MKRLLCALLIIMFVATGCSGVDKETQEVINTINNIGEVNIESQEDIELAESLYSELNDKQKERVNNYNILLESRELLDKIKLNEKEQLVLESLIITANNNFYNPTELRVLEVGFFYDMQGDDRYPNGSKSIELKIQGENRIGGTSNGVYMLYLENQTFISENGKELKHSKGDIFETNTTSLYSDEDIDISKINNALIRHWESLGLK